MPFESIAAITKRHSTRIGLETAMFDWSTKFDPERIGIAKNAQRTPDRPACIMPDGTISFGLLDREINILAAALQRLGLRPGDSMSTLFQNRNDVFVVWAAAAKLKVTALILNFKLKESELAYILEDSECKLLLYDTDFKEIVEKLKSKMIHAVPIPVCSGGQPLSGGFRLEALMSHSASAPPQAQEPSGIVPPTLAYTSGTTGKPKGVFRSGGNRLEYLLRLAHLFGSGHDDVHLVAGPLYHAGPFGWAAFSILLGNTVVIMPKFDAEAFLRLVSEYKVTTTFLVPTMVQRILNLPHSRRRQYDITSLQSLTVSGEFFPPAMKQKCIDYFGEGKLYEFYGSTETGVVTYIRPQDQLRKPGSCGKVLDGIKIKILNDDRQEVPPGEVGVLYVKSPYLLDGYHKNPEATKANYYDGYFTIGDMGYMDDEGFYYILDRAVDMIISGGVNIYPAEIEEVLFRHKDIKAAAVIGVADSHWGEKIVAFVVPGSGARIEAGQVIDYIGANLASYKKPKEVVLVDQLPVSATGKILKRELRQTYVDNLTKRK